MIPTTRSRPVIAVFAAVVLVAACGGEPGTVVVTDAWGQPTPPGVDVGALYVTIENHTDTEVRIEAVDSDRCGRTELHATRTVDDVMQMRPATDAMLTLAPGATVEMFPGRLHVMCLDMTTGFVAGEQVSLVIDLGSTAFEVTATIEVR